MTSSTKIWTKHFVSLFLTNMSVFFVFYGLINVLPLYATGELQRGSGDAGLLLTAFLLSAIVVRPFTGKLLDVVGKRKMLLLSMVLYLITSVLYIFIKQFELLLMLRLIQGIAFSIVTTANNAVAADIVPRNRQGQGLGYFAMSQNLALVLGPFVALLLAQFVSFEILFMVMSVVVLVGSFIAWTIDIPEQHFSEGKPKLRFSWSDLIEKQALPAAVIGGFVAFSYAAVLSFLSVYALEKDLLGMASIFYLVFAAAMLITRPYTGRIFDLKGPKYIIIPGFLLFAIGLFIMANINGAWSFLLAGAFIGVGYGSLVPSLQTLSVQQVKQGRTGYATATFFTVFDAGIAAGSAILGVIAVKYGFEYVYMLAAGLGVIVLIGYCIQQFLILPRKSI